ncbi:MAG: FG-GAP repeat domain-containing protein [Bdellovibrio sp.]
MSFKKTAMLIFGSMTLVSVYQNCAPQKMQFIDEASLESANIPEAPICRDMTAEEIKPTLDYAWIPETSVLPEYNQVMASPVVGDIDGDGIPEILFVNFKGSAYNSEGVLRVIDGRTGATKWSVSSDDLRPHGTTTPLLLDIDRDGKPEIFYLQNSKNTVVALNNDGSLRWKMTIPTSLSGCKEGFAGAQFSAHKNSSVIAGNIVISEDETKTPFIDFKLEETTGSCGSYATSLGTQKGTPSVVVGATGVFNEAGKKLWSFVRGGSVASADLIPEVSGVEVVVTGGGYFTIYNGLTGEVIVDKSLSEHSELICRFDANKRPIIGGGQASIGDFDGKPETLEIAIATGKSLTIFDSHGNKIAGSVTQDCSSLVTGITSFDFNGDGKPEIIYGDEQYLRIYEMDKSGELKVIWSTINPSGTLREYPVVADVNGDGYAELVVVANNYAVSGLYKTTEEKEAANKITGVRVFKPSTQQAWMPTRKLWNQHSYFSTHINDNLTANSSTIINDTSAKSFKVNLQGRSTTTNCRSQSTGG